MKTFLFQVKKLQLVKPIGTGFSVTVQINRQAGVNGIGKYCGQYGLSEGTKSLVGDISL